MTRFLTLLLFLLHLPAQAQESPRVLVSVKPIHSLVSHLLLDITQPELLLDGRQSPHDYQLRPSDAQKLSNADIIIWVGPTLESFLQKRIKKTGDKIIIQLTNHKIPDNTEMHLHHDPHRWLDPQLAIADSRRIADVLRIKFPDHRQKITSNFDHLVNRLHELDAELAGMFSNNKELSAVFYHDAWHYYTSHYSLNAHGVINPSAHQQPGTRQLGKLMQAISDRKTRCFLIEPQFKPRYLHHIKQKHQLSILSVDPLGADEPPGKNAYFDMMRNNTKTFSQCL